LVQGSEIQRKESFFMIKSISLKCFGRMWRTSTAILCGAALVFADPCVASQAQEQTPQANAPPQSATPAEQEAKIPADQLDSLVAPIALYPDPMLAQVLAASTYPLEIIQLQQWLTKNKDLKDKALADAVAKQPWDPSVQALAGLPDVVKRLSDDIQWTTDLGNAFLAQQNDVMDAVQRMRAKAQEKGNLKSNEQQKVETKVVESKQVIVIEQANPQVVYVPSYNPTVVYGPPAYPYPPVYYPPPGYYAAGMAISFGVGVAMGAMWSGGWGYNCGWGGNNNITINNNNNFNRNTNVQGGNRVNGGNRGGAGGGGWQHNPKHRGGTPYSNRQTANKFGGTTRGSSVADRQANARRNTSNRGQGNRGGVGDNRGDRGGVGDNRGGVGNNRGGAGDRSGNRGGGDRVGDRSTSRSGGSRGMSGGGMNGSSARASSSRGSSSMGSRGGGGGGGRRR
jgi:Protein of unknown function (DUF3300)